MRNIIAVFAVLATFTLSAQTEVYQTFASTRIINGHSNETLKKRELEFRIEHRFGDMAGEFGGVQNWFGFDNASDIRFAFEYGITDRLMIGLGRNKGSGQPYRSLVDGFAKYKILAQTEDNSMPVSLAVIGSAFGTYMTSNPDISSVTHFEKFAHRMTYSTQLVLTHKIGSRISLAILPTYLHRNYVDLEDQNGLLSVGGAFNLKLTKNIGIITEYFQNFNQKDLRDGYKNSLGFAFEWITNGHNFHINLTNSRGFTEAQYIPYTTANWLDGEFRLGFSIARTFKIK